MHHVGPVVGRHEREVVPQAANGADDWRIAGQEHGDEAGDPTFGERLVHHVGVGQAGLWSSVGLVLDHDRQAGQRRRHHQVDRSAVRRRIGDGDHVAVDQRRDLVRPGRHAQRAWLNGATVDLHLG